MSHRPLRTARLLRALGLLVACAADGRAQAAAASVIAAPAAHGVGARDATSPGASRAARAESGYDLWLRYRPMASPALARAWRGVARTIVVVHEGADANASDARAPNASTTDPSTTDATLRAAADELRDGLEAMLGAPVPVRHVTLGRRTVRAGTRATTRATLALPDGALVLGTTAALARVPALAALVPTAGPDSLGGEGFRLRAGTTGGRRVLVVTGPTAVGALYGAFALLGRAQEARAPLPLDTASRPRVAVRILNHWDNLDRSVERGYAGRSLWAWDSLPDRLAPATRQRYRDYARANASLGLNATVLTNVNADARVLTAGYLRKVAALADVFRPYGVRVWLTARFTAPIEIGGLRTADPQDPAVRAWWRAKADEVWRTIPDFGGFVVKANSEGQPGPGDYGRTHADGANLLADAVAPHGGRVMWRAFVYSHETPVDRIRQAYDEFRPLDGAFRPNVIVQVKNGPLDFQPREPFHPLFGAMPRTPLALELQITKEYLGQDTHLAWLAPLWTEVLAADTHARGAGSTVARVVDGSLYGDGRVTAVAGVANVGTDVTWTGSHFNQANWYAFGRLAWDPTLPADGLAREWARRTWGTDPAVVEPVARMLAASREAVVDYTGPLGLVHLMAEGHHYGPGPWVDQAGRADWTATYYHRADTLGLGFDRTRTGSDAVAQYAAPVAERFARRDQVPPALLLWFHRVRWDERLASGHTLWDALALRYQAGVDTVRALGRTWAGLAGRVDPARHAAVAELLAVQEREARWWRDASLLYFQQFSRRPLPAGVEPAPRPLAWYRALRCPADRDRPRCPDLP